MEVEGNVIRLITEFFLLRELENLANKGDFRFVSPGTVLTLLERLEESKYYSRLKGRAAASTLDTLLSVLWERAAARAQAEHCPRGKWMKVMGLCNSMLCDLIPEGTRDHYITYLGDIQSAAKQCRVQ